MFSVWSSVHGDAVYNHVTCHVIAENVSKATAGDQCIGVGKWRQWYGGMGLNVE